MSRPDTSIFENIKPLSFPDPLAQASKALSLSETMQQMKTQGLQQQDIQEQIQQRHQANARTAKASQVLNQAFAGLPLDTDVDTKIRTGMDALQKAGLDKEAAEYGDTWAKYRKSVSEQKAADRADHTAKLTDESKQHELVGQSMGALLGLSPEDQYAAYSHYYPGAVKAGVFDPNDPMTPAPETLTPQTITPTLTALQSRAQTAQQQTELARQIANDTVANNEKKAQTDKAKKDIEKAQADIDKTNAELAGTLPTDKERDIRQEYKVWLDAKGLPDNPGNKSRFRTVEYPKILESRAKTDPYETARLAEQKRHNLATEEPKDMHNLTANQASQVLTQSNAAALAIFKDMHDYPQYNGMTVRQVQDDILSDRGTTREEMQARVKGAKPTAEPLPPVKAGAPPPETFIVNPTTKERLVLRNGKWVKP